MKISQTILNANIIMILGMWKKAFNPQITVRQDTFFCPRVTHAAMEPHSTVANYEANKLTVWSSTQTPYYLHRTISLVLGMPMSRIRIIKPLVGGGFGGKDEPLGHEITVARSREKPDVR